MSDGVIKIDIEIDGKPIKVVTADLKELEAVAKKSADGPESIKKSMKDIDSKKVKESSDDFKILGDSSKKSATDVNNVKDNLKGIDGKPIKDTKEKMNEFTEETKKGQKSVKDLVVALGLVKVASAALNVLKDSMSSAVARFDTLEKFPRVLQSMGFEAQQSERAMERMSNSIEGLPTTLNDMVSLTQKFVNITGDLDKSVDTAEALNNAMLASGSDSADAARGIEQYSQMLANGKVDMQSWKSVNETMGYGLKRVAEEMIGAGATAMDLYSKLQGGEITMEELNSKIIELGGSTGELADLARKNSEGIATSFANLKNSVVKGLANVMKALDTVITKATGKSIAQNLDSLKAIVNNTFKIINKSIESTVPVAEALGKAFGFLAKAADTLSPAIVGLMVAFAGIKAVEKAKTAFETASAAIKIAKASADGLKATTIALTATKAQEVAAIELSNAATKKEIATNLASNGVITAKTLLLGAFTNSLKLSELAALLSSKAMGALSGAMSILLAHPIIAFIAGLVAVLTAATKISHAMNKEFYESQKEMQGLTDQTKENSKATTDNIRQRETKLKNMDKETSSSKDLADRLGTLTQAEKASRDSKKEINETVEELNRLYPELNLRYDESTNKVNKNAEAIKSQIDAYTSLDKVQAVQENLSASTKELSEAEAEQTRIAEDLKNVRQQKSDTDWYSVLKMRELKKTENELVEQETANGERRKNLHAEQKALIEQQAQAQEQALAAQKAAIEEAGLQYDFLSDKQKKAVDSMKENYQQMLGAATSFTSDLSYELDMTGQELINFVEKNQGIMSQWADNLKILTERGANQGWVEQLRNMGPEGAKYAQIAVNMSDEEFNKMNDLFAGAPKVTADSWKKAFGMENIDPAVASLVMQGKTTLDQEIAKADFGSLGLNVGKGAAEGVNESAGEFSKATGDMAEQGAEEFKNENEIHSPSRLYERFGQFITQGLVNGINNSRNLLVSAMGRMSLTILTEGLKMLSTTKTIANQIPNQFQGLSSQMNLIGMNIMQGLAFGIEAASGSAISAAQSVASRIKHTMQEALDIHSPSRWMRDKIGRFIPQGIAVGIREDAQEAYIAMERLSDGLMNRISPEQALNVSGMGNSIPSNNTSNSTTNHYSSSFEGLFKGANLNVRSDEDIPKLAKAVVEEMNRFNPNRVPGIRRSF